MTRIRNKATRVRKTPARKVTSSISRKYVGRRKA